MCIARVGRVLAVSNGRSLVRFFDGRTSGGIDTSMVRAGVGSYVEVFGSLAISKIDSAEAKERRAAWREVRRAASEMEV